MIICQLITIFEYINDSMIKKPKIDEDKLNKGNPFVDNLSIPLRRISKQEYKKQLNGDFVLEEDHVTMEYTPFVKVFNTSQNRIDFTALSMRSKELLMWIMYECEAGRDWLWINKVRYMDENGVGSYNTYVTAIRELVEQKFLAISTTKDVYYINPDMFFCGDRVRKYKEQTFIKYDDIKNI